MEEREKLSFRVAWLLVAVKAGASPARARGQAPARRASEPRRSDGRLRESSAALLRRSAHSRHGRLAPGDALSELAAPLRRIVGSLEVGQPSAVIGVPSGFAVLKLLEREESSLPSYEEARNELAQRVYLEK